MNRYRYIIKLIDKSLHMSTFKTVFHNIFVAKGIKKVTRQVAFPLLSKQIESDLSCIKGKEFYHGRLSSVKHVSYIRSDFWLKNSTPNGAAAHTEGVVNALVKQGYEVNIVSSYPLPYLKSYHSLRVCTPDGWTTGISELEEMEYNRQLLDSLKKSDEKPDLVYQRYGRNNYAGLLYARQIGVPYILEYNGSEIWMSKNWAHSLRFESVTDEIERCVLTHADLVVGNAEAFRSELVSKGVEERRVLIIPNGVDPDRFNPTVSGKSVRESLGVGDEEIVVSFSGSYGPWHGAEILARTIPLVTSENKRIRYLFIGGGTRFENVKKIVFESDASDRAVFTGFVDRDIMPEYLAASDILVSPQVPNPDGTPFFGSPTKLFEYMSMGKAIVASDLDQIGRLLTHKENAILVPPGNANKLAEAILSLAEDSALRTRIGSQARIVAMNKYSWDSHVCSILDYVIGNQE